jgi:branched-subunit amino acid aminotransferase/4-amino-4-deoxychorismate lyase
MRIEPASVCWVDGAIAPADQAVVRVDDSAYSEGRGCFTSIRIAAGQPRFADRHVERLQRGADALRLGEIDETTIRRALTELAAAALPAGEGVVRLQVSCDGEGTIHLVGVARGLGEDAPEWSAITVTQHHDGASISEGRKVTSRLTLSLAAEDARSAGVNEAVLLDSSGHLVEGARSNLFVATRGGSIWTPPIASGAVAGIARSIAIERLPEIEERGVSRSELLAAAELIAVNAVRGARAITRLDGCVVGDGEPGPWCARLAEILAAD